MRGLCVVVFLAANARRKPARTDFDALGQSPVVT
jgi:hypothetical protein